MKKFMVLDVEGYSTCRPYDVGFRVVDKSGKVYEEYSVAFMPAIFENLCEMCRHHNNDGMRSANEMAHKNIQEILSDKDGKYKKCYSADNFFYCFMAILTKYSIKRIWAYNCTFDKGAIYRLFGEERFNIISNLVTWCDIIPAITYTYLLSADYVEFCKSNNFITEKGNIRTKAEVVYRYLTGDINFIEAHTGLEDTKIETFILLTAMGKTKNPHYTPIQAWKVIKEFCECEGIEMPVPPEAIQIPEIEETPTLDNINELI